MENEKFIQELRNHPLIREKVQESKPHISSFNFTRKAFFDSLWDSTNIRARGLFINTETNKIVARSWNKFFNLNERNETKDRNLEKNLKFPITAYKKENGYLGILGYDDKEDELLFCSKSTIDGDFAIKFKEIFYSTHAAWHIVKLKSVLKEQNISMVFEVISPTFDPHMIEYDNDQVILLDVIKNQEQFDKLDYDALIEWGNNHYPRQIKERTIVLNSWKEFTKWLDDVQNERIEGYVVEDSAGFCFKIKLPYYSFWKYMRSIKDRILKLRREEKDQVKDLQRDISDISAKMFTEWAWRQPTEILEQDIIKVRAKYLNGE